MLKTLDIKICKKINVILYFIYKHYKESIVEKNIYKGIRESIQESCLDSTNKKEFKKVAKTLLNQNYKQYKNEINKFLTEVYDLYQGLMKSSIDIDKVFQTPLNILKTKQV